MAHTARRNASAARGSMGIVPKARPVRETLRLPRFPVFGFPNSERPDSTSLVQGMARAKRPDSICRGKLYAFKRSARMFLTSLIGYPPRLIS